MLLKDWRTEGRSRRIQSYMLADSRALFVKYNSGEGTIAFQK